MTFEAPDADVLRADDGADDSLWLPFTTRHAAEDVQAEAAVLGKRVAGEVRLGEHLQPGEATGVRKAVPHRLPHGCETSGRDDGGEQPLEGAGVAQRLGVTPRRVYHPFDA